MFVDLVLVSDHVARYRQRFFNYPETEDRTVYLNSVDASCIGLNYHRFTYTGHPMIRTAIIELDDPRSGEQYVQVYCVNGVASEVQKVLSPCQISAGVLNSSVIYLMAARLTTLPLPSRIPLISRMKNREVR